MKRFLLFLLLLAIIIVVAVAILLTRVGDIVKYAVEEYGPKYAETDVKVEKVGFSLLGGSATIDNFYVQNPEGFSDARLLSLGHAHFALKPTSLLGEVVDIQDITIKNPEFLLEVEGRNITNNNLSKLLENIKKNTPQSEGGDKPDVEQPKAGEKAPKKLIVRNLLLEGVKVNVKIADKSQAVTIPTIHLKDLGVAAGGITGAQLSQEILGKILGDIITVATREVIEGQVKDVVEDAKKEISKGLSKELGEEKAEEVGKALEGILPGF